MMLQLTRSLLSTLKNSFRYTTDRILLAFLNNVISSLGNIDASSVCSLLNSSTVRTKVSLSPSANVCELSCASRNVYKDIGKQLSSDNAVAACCYRSVPIAESVPRWSAGFNRWRSESVVIFGHVRRESWKPWRNFRIICDVISWLFTEKSPRAPLYL